MPDILTKEGKTEQYPERNTSFDMIKKLKKILLAAWQDFTNKRVLDAASNLTYSTLLATVPILAVVFAIARGFGYNVHIEEWFRSILQAQPEACETIIGFVNSYLIHTKKGIFLGIGLLFLFWTVLMLVQNIEQTFNDIWQVKRKRSLFRTFTDYIAMLFMVPIYIVVSSGLSIWITAIDKNISGIYVLGPVMGFILQLLIEIFPYVISSGVFIALYVFMPNTKVKVSSAVWPGIIAGVSFQLFQVLYINSQIWISKYNAIYGSFAILPFFMLWMQISWSICLIGAQLSYMNQNREDFSSSNTNEPISHDATITASAYIMAILCRNFYEGKTALTAFELNDRTGISMRLLSQLLFNLEEIHFVSSISDDEKGEETRYQPAEALNNLTLGELIKRLDSRGRMLETSASKEAKQWQNAIDIRGKYLAESSEIELKDLA